MKKTFTLLIALLALCVSSWATQIGPIDGFYYEVDGSGNATLIKDPTAVQGESYGSSVANGVVTIPASVNFNSTDYPVKGIGENAFLNCYYITAIIVEEGIEEIGNYAFFSCGSLTTVSLPSTITSLGNNAFSYSSNFNTLICKATLPPTFGDFVFEYVTAVEHIYVPSANVATYKAAAGWSDYATIIEAIPASVTWNAAALESVNVSQYYGEYDPRSKAVNGVAVTATALGSEDNSSFTTYEGNTSLYIENGGTITFTSFLGNMTRIVIHTDDKSGYGSATGWTWSDHDLIWTGNASSVVMTDGSAGRITSIDFTFASNDPEPAPASTTITWEASDLATVEISQNASQEIKTITVTSVTPDEWNDNCYFNNNNSWPGFSMNNNGALTFAPKSDNLTSIVITCDLYPSDMTLASGWTWDGEHSQLKWTGNEASVTLQGDGSSTSFTSGRISSIVFTVSSAAPAPTPTPAGPSFIWAERQVSHVDLSDNATSPVIKNIILKRTDNTGSCSFSGRHLSITNDASLTFQSIVGELSKVVITCSSVYSTGTFSDGWTYDNVNNTYTWTGTPSDEVTLSGELNFMISSIEFFYTPAAAPRKGDQFMGDYNQIYEITGAQTAKLPAQTIDHTLNIPASVEYYGDTYYVTEIDDYAFYHNEDLPNIMGGENIAKIGAQAFDGCIRMDEANIESTVLDTIGDAAFYNCKLMFSFMCETEFPPVLGSSVFYNDNYLNHIRVFTPSDYQTADGWNWYADKIGGMYPTPAIGEQFFWYNQMTCNLYEVSSTDPREAKVLPYNAEINAIYPITREGTLVIPEMADYMNFSYNITGIGANAYKNETNIDLVVMPLAMKSIESGAFLGCTGVEKVYFLWDDPTTVSWYDKDKGFEFKTATGGTKIFVPKGKLEAYQTWAPAWRDCMIEGDVVDAVATEDPVGHARYYRTFYDSSSDYMMPAGVWAHAGYVEGGSFMLSPVAFDGQILPRGTAVVLESDTREYRLIPMGNDAPLYDGRNELVGTDENLEVSTLGTNSDKVYVLNTQATIGTDLKVGMGMYKYTGTTLGAHKAYLIYDAPAGSNSAPARFVFKHENQATGVENVQSDKVQCTKVIRDGQLIIIKDGKEYNAQGQKLR